MSSAADRQRAHRARGRRGLVVLRVQVDEVALTEKLLEAGLLELDDADDRAAIEAATERLLAALCHT